MATVATVSRFNLASGDRLTRAEFERRYAALPETLKCELIEGIVYMASPLRYGSHAKPHSQIMGWLSVYAAATLGVECADNATVRLDLDNEVQPDALLRLLPACGGRTRVSEDDYLEGAPELIAEIAASSASIDAGFNLAFLPVYAVYDKADDGFQACAHETADHAGITPV